MYKDTPRPRLMPPAPVIAETERSKYCDTPELRLRGWTRHQRRSLLGAPDGWAVPPLDIPYRLWSRERVLAAEATVEWQNYRTAKGLKPLQTMRENWIADEQRRAEFEEAFRQHQPARA